MGSEEKGDSGQQVEETSGDEQSSEDQETSLGEALSPTDDPEEVDRLIEDAVEEDPQ